MIEGHYLLYNSTAYFQSWQLSSKESASAIGLTAWVAVFVLLQMTKRCTSLREKPHGKSHAPTRPMLSFNCL